VRRVELRVNRRGLRFTAQDGTKVNLTDPAALADTARLAQLWAHHTHRVRLVLPTATRLHRAELDPRWVAVQGAASWTPPPGWRQDRIGEAVAAETIANRRRLAERAAMRHSAAVQGHTMRRFGGLRDSDFEGLSIEAQIALATQAFERELQNGGLRGYREALRRVDGTYAAWPNAQALLNSPPSADDRVAEAEEKTNENKHLVNVCPADKWRSGSLLKNAAPNPEATETSPRPAPRPAPRRQRKAHQAQRGGLAQPEPLEPNAKASPGLTSQDACLSHNSSELTNNSSGPESGEGRQGRIRPAQAPTSRHRPAP